MVSAVLLGLLGALLAPAAAAPAATQTASAVAPLVDTAGVWTPGSPGLLIGAVGAYGLPADYSIPAGISAAARAAVTFALAQRGKPYVFGAIGPRSYDCSGLTMTAWSHAGRQITRTTLTQRFVGTATDVSTLRAGDLVVTPGGLGSLANPDHVGLYIGHGWVIHAPHTGDVVRVVTRSSFVAGGVSAYRHIA